MKATIYNLNDVHKASSKKLFTVISTFAGGGGSSTGYRLAGGVVLAANEFVDAAREAYGKNYPSTLLLPEDIRELTGEEILKRVGLNKGELDIFDGSPPCSSFSMAGNREKDWGKVKKYSDKTQRTDDLFYEYARLLKELQPRVFIAENVKGLTVGSAMDLLGSSQKNLFEDNDSSIYNTLTGCGYRVQFRVLNAKHYGVPQTRERTIFIGVRKDINKPITWPKISKNFVSVGEAFKDVDNSKAELKFVLGETLQYLKQAKPGESLDKYHPKGNYFTHLRIDPNLVSPTLTAVAQMYHHIEDRFLSIPECIRIQSFPDDYYLGDKFPKMWERLGRSVPPLMMKAISEHVYNTILK